MPVYTPPVFNVVADLWLPPAVPAANPPSFTAVSMQPYINSRNPPLLLHPGSGRWLPVIIVRIPFGFPIFLPIDAIWRYGVGTTQGAEHVKVQYVQRLHTGFPNQYYAAICLQCNANGTIPKTPLPTP